jgi:streptogramin lyase
MRTPRLLLASTLTLLAVLLPVAPRAIAAGAAPQTSGVITEFTLPTANSQPYGITAGPDDRLWFTEFNNGSIGQITPSGTITETPLIGSHDPYYIASGPNGNLWFTELRSNYVDQMTTTGTGWTSSLLPTNPAYPEEITGGSDGNVWFAEGGAFAIARVTPTGTVTEFTTPTGGTPYGVTKGPDGNIWYTTLSGRVGSMAPNGTAHEYSISGTNVYPEGITAGPDGNLWVAENGAGKIGKVTTSGSITSYSIPTANAGPQDIAAGADGALWFTEANGNKIGRITTSGTVTEYPVPTSSSVLAGITQGADGNIWFTESQGNRIGRITVTPVRNLRADFNGDGFADLAVGVAGEDIGTIVDAGAVNVIYGSSTGLHATGNQQWYEGNNGVPGSPATGDEFGASVAAGDFNADGFADLAIGIPFDFVAGQPDGAVQILFGSASGLTATGNQLLTRGFPSPFGQNDFPNAFGFALATGDLNGDGDADLAVGAPFENTNGSTDSGSATVYFGAPTGLGTGPAILRLDEPTLQGSNESYDWFGYALTIGDFNKDGFGELAIGIPFQTVSGKTGAGTVDVVPGSQTGPDVASDVVWSQDSPSITGGAEIDDAFGGALATGDLNGDGSSDLAVGAPLEDIGSIVDAGGVNVILGSASGLTATGNQFWDQNSSGIAGTSEKGDEMGASLAIGDFNGDLKADLAAGAPIEAVGSLAAAGGINVILGSASGLVSPGNQFWDQNNSGILDQSEAGDEFGFSLVAADFGKGTQADLIASVPDEDLSSAKTNAGAVNAIYGSSLGLTSTGNQFWDQDSTGIQGAAEKDDFFGAWVASGPGGAQTALIRQPYRS